MTTALVLLVLLVLCSGSVPQQRLSAQPEQNIPLDANELETEQFYDKSDIKSTCSHELFELKGVAFGVKDFSKLSDEDKIAVAIWCEIKHSEVDNSADYMKLPPVGTTKAGKNAAHACKTKLFAQTSAVLEFPKHAMTVQECKPLKTLLDSSKLPHNNYNVAVYTMFPGTWTDNTTPHIDLRVNRAAKILLK